MVSVMSDAVAANTAVRLAVSRGLKRRRFGDRWLRATALAGLGLALLFPLLLLISLALRAQAALGPVLLTAMDSTSPERAGVLGALAGSGLALLTALAVAAPVGVLAGVHLEEFARRGRLTAIVEANLNNLAAAPSVIYGLLGLAVFVELFGAPRASPLVGGLVLALMALPAVINATRSCLAAIPFSIREAALGAGASRVQTLLQHLLPLAWPGMVAGVLLALSRALGQAAPLLIVGSAAFSAEPPRALTSPAETLPSEIFTWFANGGPAFAARAAAAALLLLLLMGVLNGAGQLFRRRFERGW
jgi:phosphate transport system permease protein